jgi:glycosyltransferase involved in cell wall biosynthesis
MKTILFVDPVKFLGGAEKCVIRLANAMSRRGMKSIFLTSESVRNYPKPLFDPEVERIYCSSSSPFSPGIFTNIYSIIRKKVVDLVVLNGDRSGFWGRLVKAVARPPVPFIWIMHLHHDDMARNWHFPKKLIYKLGYLATLPFCDFIVTVSSANKEKLIQKEGVPVEKIHVIYNTVGYEESNNREDLNLRDVYNIKSDEIVIGSICQINKQKGLEYLVEALVPLCKTYKLKAVIAGDGPSRDHIAQLVKKKGLSDKIIMPGYIHNVSDHMKLFDIYAMPSVYEGFPIALVEAMSYNLPVIATDIDGCKEAIENGRNGLLVAAKDSKSLESAIRRLILDAPLRERLGKEAGISYRKRFHPEIIFQQYYDFFHWVLSEE